MEIYKKDPSRTILRRCLGRIQLQQEPKMNAETKLLERWY